jgi:hypothetical protein
MLTPREDSPTPVAETPTPSKKYVRPESPHAKPLDLDALFDGWARDKEDKERKKRIDEQKRLDDERHQMKLDALREVRARRRRFEQMRAEAKAKLEADGVEVTEEAIQVIIRGRMGGAMKEGGRRGAGAGKDKDGRPTTGDSEGSVDSKWDADYDSFSDDDETGHHHYSRRSKGQPTIAELEVNPCSPYPYPYPYINGSSITS